MDLYSPEELAFYLKVVKSNNNAAKTFGAAVGVLMGVFVIRYWLNLLIHRWRGRHGGTASTALLTTRWVRSILMRKFPLFNSVGHFIVFAIYLGINVFVCFWDLDNSQLTILAYRMGGVASVNLALLVFLSLKNTPMAILSPYSYERLNIFHRIVGYTTVACVIAHATIFLYKYRGSADEYILREHAQIYGMVSATCMVIAVLAASLIRHFKYEVFYVAHISMFIVAIVMVGLHRPNIAGRTFKVILFSACIWFLDRLIRFLRISYHFLGTSVTINPLHSNAVRLSFSPRTRLFRAQAGSHVFLWIPGVRVAETHPFTLVSTNPLELVIAARDGFTRDLRQKALRQPGLKMRASVDGPYGALPSWGMYDRVLLVTGGSGASFSIGVALELVRKAARTGATGQVVSFVWAIRDKACLTWYVEELKELCASRHSIVSIYVTEIETMSSSDTSIVPVTVLTPSPSTFDNTISSQSRPLTFTTHVSNPGNATSTLRRQQSLPTTSLTPTVTTNKSNAGTLPSSLPTSPSDTLADFDKVSFDEKTTTSPKPYIINGLDKEPSSPVDLEKKDFELSADVPFPEPWLSNESDFNGSNRDGQDSPTFAATPSYIRFGRPMIKHLVQEFVSIEPSGTKAGIARQTRYMVAGCGPGKMMDDVRESVSNVLRKGNLDVEMHLEQFGW